jgi:hypothetical protein
LHGLILKGQRSSRGLAMESSVFKAKSGVSPYKYCATCSLIYSKQRGYYGQGCGSGGEKTKEFVSQDVLRNARLAHRLPDHS